MKSLLKKIFRNKKKQSDKNYRNFVIPKIENNKKKIILNKNLSFLHYGHLGDIINSLPVIKELSKSKNCKLFLQIGKEIPKHVALNDHPFGKVYLSEVSIKKLLPLLKNQKYIQEVKIFNNEKIDIDLNFFREMPINFNIDSVRWYFHLTGQFPDLAKDYLEVPEHKKYKDYIVIMRSLRRQNKNINYSFLSKYKKIVFIGLKSEFDDLKSQINNLEYYESNDFLELASVIKNSKIFIGNLSFGYALAEAIKVPRLLESGPNFPLVYPNGENAFDFYFQSHFEDLVEKLNNI